MNKKIYWKIRKELLSILFKCKAFAYKSTGIIHTSKDRFSFGLVVFKKGMVGLIYGFVITTILFAIDRILLKMDHITKIDGNIFVAVVIGCLSVSGVILGLYCSNISSIYSSKYSNAPELVSNAFQYDRLTQQCIGAIINYIIFGFIVIIEILIGCSMSWGTVLATILWSIVVIISYGVAGKRAYQLADIYSVADDSYRVMYRIIANNLNQKIYSGDVSFQNHFQKICERQIKLLNQIQKFADTLPENNNATMVQFMYKNIALVESYWEIKQFIARDSYWFRNTQKYQKWHLTDDIETSTALRTGTTLRSKTEHDYWWFENEIFSLNHKCIACLCKANDYSSLYTYLSCFDTICEVAIENKEVNYFVNQIKSIQELIEKMAIETERKDEEENKVFAGIVERISLLYLGVILGSSHYCNNLDIERGIKNTINLLDKGITLNKCKLLRGNKQLDFFNKVITEIQVEKKRLTPDWLIAQNVAKEAHAYINSLEDAICVGIDNIYNLGQHLYDKKFLFEACIISMRFYEYESKLSRFTEIVQFKEKELSEYHIDKEMIWENSHIGKLEHTMGKWKKLIPTLLSNCSSEFAIKTWEMSDTYPDFLGECYNHICKDAIEAITQNNIAQFQIDYENLSKLMLLYQEYIRTDFVRKQDVYRKNFAYYMFTSPIVEWAQIGGLAIIWGEFKSITNWRSIVDTVTSQIFGNDSKRIQLAETFIEYIQNRDRYRLGIGYRDFIETEWQQQVTRAIPKNIKRNMTYMVCN